MTSQFKSDSKCVGFVVLSCIWSPTAANDQGAPDALNPMVTVDTLGTTICRDRLHQVDPPAGRVPLWPKTRQRSGIRLHGVTMPTPSLPILFFRPVSCQAVRDW